MYREYFDITKDKEAHFFVISNSPYPAAIYSESVMFGEGKHKVCIIDQFDGKRPILLNYEYLVERKNIDLEFMHSIILDSHLVTGLHEYLIRKDGGKPLRADVHSAIEKFLEHVSNIKCDYNPIFYMTENFYNVDEDIFIEKVSPVLSSILKLHCMDEREFINSKRVLIRQRDKEHYFNLHQGDSFEECALNWVTEFSSSHEKKFYDMQVELTYACLLKMTLINYRHKKQVNRKNDEFKEFLFKELGALLAWELNLATHYFSGFTGKLINPDPNMSVEKAKKNLWSTAWDVLLLKIPQMLLNANYLPEVTLAYVATSEEKLMKVGDLITLESQYCRSDSFSPMIPTISFNLKDHQDKYGRDKINELIKANNKMAIERIFEEKGRIISPAGLKCLIQDLEVQLSFLCRGST